MTRREVQFLWAGIAVGFVFGMLATVIGLAHYGVIHLAYMR